MPELPRTQHLIQGQARPSVAEAWFDKLEPATGLPVARVATDH